MQARICTSSSNSIRATGIPDWMVRMTVFTASSNDGYWQTADVIDSGMPYSRRWTSVITPSVPSEPM